MCEAQAEVLALRRALAGERSKAQREARTAELASQNAVRRVLQQLIDHTRQQREAAVQQHHAGAADAPIARGGSDGGSCAPAHSDSQRASSAGRLRPLSASIAAPPLHMAAATRARLRPASATAAPQAAVLGKRRPASARVHGSAGAAERHNSHAVFSTTDRAFSSAHARLGKPRPSSAKGCFGTTASVVRHDVSAELMSGGALTLTRSETDAMLRVRSASHALDRRATGRDGEIGLIYAKCMASIKYTSTLRNSAGAAHGEEDAGSARDRGGLEAGA